MSYPVIKENSQRHFLNSLYPDGGSWLIDSVGLVCLVALSLIGMAARERQWQSSNLRPEHRDWRAVAQQI
jgi:hypothetical protein